MATRERMESLLQQATFGGCAHGRWCGATNFAPEWACRRGYAALDFDRRDKDRQLDARKHELPKRQKKTRAYKARRGKITRHSGSQKKGFKNRENVKFGCVMTLMTAAGMVIANEKLMPACKNGGNVTGPALKQMLRQTCSRKCGTSQPANRAGWYAPRSRCEQYDTNLT